MIPILVLKIENKVIYNKSNLNCKTFFEEFSYIEEFWHQVRSDSYKITFCSQTSHAVEILNLLVHLMSLILTFKFSSLTIFAQITAADKMP